MRKLIWMAAAKTQQQRHHDFLVASFIAFHNYAPHCKKPPTIDKIFPSKALEGIVVDKKEPPKTPAKGNIHLLKALL